MKVLVLSCATGGGHNACARYIEEEFRKNGIPCDFVDYFSLIGKKASKRAEKIYVSTTKCNGRLFKEFYKLGELYEKTNLTSPVYALNKLAKEKLSKYIEENKYDLIITPHLFPAMTTTALKKSGKSIPLINVATDYRCIPFWEETTPDYFVIPDNSLTEHFLEKGFKKESLLPYGIPVASSVQNTKIPNDIPKNKDIVLLTSGSMGFGKMEEIVKSILKKLPEVFLIVICGKNKKLLKRLSKIKNENLLVKGFVENMKDYIASSTICLTKPGGLTSTEIAILNRPMIHIMPIPGVENYNAKFFSENGLSLVASTMEEVIENTRDLLQDKKKQEEMVNNQKKIINKNSAAYLVEFAKKLK